MIEIEGEIATANLRLNGQGAVNVTVMGNVQNENTARLLASQVADQVARQMKQNARVTLSKG